LIFGVLKNDVLFILGGEGKSSPYHSVLAKAEGVRI
jgi:hypothetical protein